MKRLTLLTLALLITAFMATTQAEEVSNNLPKTSSAQYLPKSTNLFVSFKDINALIKTDAGKFLSSPELNSIRQNFQRHNTSYQEMIRFFTETVPSVAKEKPEYCKNIEYAVAYSGSGEPSITVSFECPESAKDNAVQEILDSIRKTNEAIPPETGKEQGEELKYTAFFCRSSYSCMLAFFHNSRVYISNRTVYNNAISEIKGKKKPCLADVKHFENAYAASHNSNLFLYSKPEKNSLLEPLRINFPVSITMGLASSDSGIKEHISLNADSPEARTYFSLLKGQEAPLTLSSAKYMPKNAPCFYAAKVPQIPAMVSSMLNAPEIVKKGLPLLGKEVGGYVSLTGTLLSYRIAIELKDVEGMKALLEGLCEGEKPLLRKRGIDETCMYTVLKRFDTTPPIAVSLTVIDNYLVIGSPLDIKELIRGNAEDVLSNNSELMAKLKASLQENPELILYGNQEQLLKEWWDLICREFGPSIWEIRYRSEDDNTPPFPKANELQPYACSQIITLNATDTGLKLQSTCGLPLPSVLTLLLMPDYIGHEESKLYWENHHVSSNISTLLQKSRAFAKENNGCYWEEGKKDFEFEEKTENWSYIYLANDTDHNGKHEATKFVLLYYPKKGDREKELYAVCENSYSYTYMITSEQIDEVVKLTGEDILWDEAFEKRIPIPNLEHRGSCHHSFRGE